MKIKEIKEIRYNIATTSTEELIAAKDKLVEASAPAFRVQDQNPLDPGANNHIVEIALTLYKIDNELQTRV
jgi:hypothetical protein